MVDSKPGNHNLESDEDRQTLWTHESRELVISDTKDDEKQENLVFKKLGITVVEPQELTLGASDMIPKPQNPCKQCEKSKISVKPRTTAESNDSSDGGGKVQSGT